MPLITNQRDRDNLRFLLSLDEKGLKQWYSQADEDDMQYARELFDSYAEELRLAAEILSVEIVVSGMETFPEVESILNKIKDIK